MPRSEVRQTGASFLQSGLSGALRPAQDSFHLFDRVPVPVIHALSLCDCSISRILTVVADAASSDDEEAKELEDGMPKDRYRAYHEARAAGEDATSPVVPSIPQVNRVKRYLDLGGMILGVAENRSSAFAQSFEDLGRFI